MPQSFQRFIKDLLDIKNITRMLTCFENLFHLQYKFNNERCLTCTQVSSGDRALSANNVPTSKIWIGRCSIQYSNA